ncbi:MAG: translocation/assembly module TamB domain-containing protein [Defluviimonas sp.]|uniref:translocation/assembly module TamB domain-containing protein n=1 Tax=Albidovulum sp. TaxID=1872424 RepID=UPI002A2E4243|nr:translocation/assembly module TamB domain-containing protein [Defluviimonas sp.]
MRPLLFLLVVLFWPLSALAQDQSETERDRGFLTGLIEDNLSGIGRTVRIDGFAGALSSRATFDQLTIADAEGVWLTIRNGAISWNRSALLGGRIEIAEMSAAEILLPRRPQSEGGATTASGFSLPDLPVAVSIGNLRADRVELGEPLFGAAAIVSLAGQMQLEGGEGSAEVAITRTDGQRGTLSFTGRYANATREGTLDLLVSEGQRGIAASLIGLPGEPSIELAVHGAGPIDAFHTEVALKTDGVSRLKGSVDLLAKSTATGATERSFSADFRGDVAPLFLPDYREFFGDDVTLQAEGRSDAAGALSLSRLELRSRGLDINGRLDLAAGGQPLAAALTVTLGLDGKGEVLLPLSGEKTWVRSGKLNFRYDAAQSSAWALEGSVGGFRRAGLALDTLALDGSGVITGPVISPGSPLHADGSVKLAAQGIAPGSEAMKQAIGDAVQGKVRFDWSAGEPLALPEVSVTGADYGAEAALSIDFGDGGATADGTVRGTVADLGRFSGVAGRPLGGAATLDLSGSAGVLSGYIDATAHVAGTGLSAGIAELDTLLKDRSTVDVALKRDESGIILQALSVRAATLSADAQGHIGGGLTDVTAHVDMPELAALGQRYGGAISADGRVRGAGDNAYDISVEAKAQDLRVGQAELDRILAGGSQLSLAAQSADRHVTIEALTLRNPQLSAEIAGTVEDTTRRLTVDARLNNMALIAPEFPGPLSITGTVNEDLSGYTLDLAARGPGRTEAAVTGTVGTDFARADLTVRGSAEAALINPLIAPRTVKGPVAFDLGLKGPLGLASLSGRVSADRLRVVAPLYGVDFVGDGVSADLAGGRATLAASGRMRAGGRLTLSGPVALARPFDAALQIGLDHVRLRDAELYDTDVTGTVAIDGPLAGGATITSTVALGPTELRVPSTGFSSGVDLALVKHRGASERVSRTLQRAGLVDDQAKGRDGAVYGLDVTVDASNRIFVRGRGLDVEMGGAVHLGGTTANVAPAGQFTLIRGRLDILGKRLTIDEGLLQLQGALAPYVRFSASSENNGVTARVLIEGVATEPRITFSSSPDLPQEEVISHLLFGKDLSSLSPLQAAQLASAVATLAGKGGEGVLARLRSSFGVDDLDVTTSDTGEASLRVGKYLSEKVYTDVAIGAGGTSEVNLNLDVTPDLTVKGSVGSDGQTGIGIYFERDY